MGDNKDNKDNKDEKDIYTKFSHVIKDFLKDVLVTFPEKKDELDEKLITLICDKDEDNTSVKYVYEYCSKIYPERFFDIVYQNQDIFEDKSMNTCFLPGLEFKDLWSCNISDKTRETIWKYLQLVLFSIVNNLSDNKSFGDTAKLFEAIEEKEFKSKLEDTINEMQSLFENSDMENSETNVDDVSNINLDSLPKPEEIHDHITDMLGGKLGTLAKEIAEETAADLNTDMDGATTVNDVFKKLFKNPGKLMDLVKNVGTKLDSKIKSGEIKESELLEEASEMMKKMKSMPGMGNLQDMLGKMGMAGGKNTKVNMGAMQSQLNQNIRKARMREKLQARQLQKQQSQHPQFPQQPPQPDNVEEDIIMKESVFSTGEVVEKSKRTNKNKNKNKKKKKNRKKN